MGTWPPGHHCWVHSPANCGAKAPGMDTAGAMWGSGRRDARMGRQVRQYWDTAVGLGVLGQVGEAGGAGMGR